MLQRRTSFLHFQIILCVKPSFVIGDTIAIIITMCYLRSTVRGIKSFVVIYNDIMISISLYIPVRTDMCWNIHKTAVIEINLAYALHMDDTIQNVVNSH